MPPFHHVAPLPDGYPPNIFHFHLPCDSLFSAGDVELGWGADGSDPWAGGWTWSTQTFNACRQLEGKLLLQMSGKWKKQEEEW